MKLLYVCDYCREIYHSQEVEGPQGSVELLGVCMDCLEDMELPGEGIYSAFIGQYH